jgi:hypothetical protein
VGSVLVLTEVVTIWDVALAFIGTFDIGLVATLDERLDTALLLAPTSIGHHIVASLTWLGRDVITRRDGQEPLAPAYRNGTRTRPHRCRVLVAARTRRRSWELPNRLKVKSYEQIREAHEGGGADRPLPLAVDDSSYSTPSNWWSALPGASA